MRVIPRNTKLPHSKSYGHVTTKDDQEELDLLVYQGESEHTDEAEYLGIVKIAPLPKGPRGSVTLEVEFQLSAECLLTVAARERSKGITVVSTFSTKTTPEVVKARLERAQRIAEAVRRAKTAASVKGGSAAKKVPPRSWWARLVSRLRPR